MTSATVGSTKPLVWFLREVWRMLVVGVLAVTLCWAPSQDREYDFWGKKLVNHMLEVDRFARGYFGCPLKGDFTVEDCRQAYGEVDWKARLKLGKQAAELWGLECK